MRHYKRQRDPQRNDSVTSARNTQTTLRLPEGLYERVKVAVQSGETGSVNEFVVNALTAYLRALERRAIDDAFKPMAKDARYRRESSKMVEQFSGSDAETIRLSEQDLVGS